MQAYDILKDIYGDSVQLNRDFIVSGALLHDVGKLLEYERDGAQFRTSPQGKLLRHPFSGVGLAYDE